MPVTIKSAREIELMAEAGRILEIVHNELRDALHAGMTMHRWMNEKNRLLKIYF